MDFYLLLQLWLKILAKNSKNLNGKYSQKPLDHAKQSAADALKTTSKGAIQITKEAVVI